MNISEEDIRKLNISYEPSPNEILSFLESHGTMSYEHAVFAMKKNEIEGILNRHPYSIREEYDGRWATYIKDPDGKNGRKRVVKSSEEALYLHLYTYYKGLDESVRISKMTLGDLYPLWVEYKKKPDESDEEVEPNTIDRYHRDWVRFYLNTDIIKVPIVSLDRKMLNEWAREIVVKHKLNKKQYHNLATIIKQSLNYAVKMGYLTESPFKDVHVNNKHFRPSRKKESSTQVFYMNEIGPLFQTAWKHFYDKSHYRQPLVPLAVLFLFYTGLRVGELRALRYSDINDEGNKIHVNKFVKSETGEIVNHLKCCAAERDVLLEDEAIRIINEARRTQMENGVSTDGYIFSMDDKPIGYSAIDKAMRKYCKEIKTCDKSAHKARKTYISLLLSNKDVSPEFVRIEVGHASLKSTFGSYFYDNRTEMENRVNLKNTFAFFKDYCSIS